MKKRITWCLAAGGMAGLALVMAAVALLLSSGGRTPTTSAAAGCTVTVTKEADSEVVFPGEDITYTITVSAASVAGDFTDCDQVTITDAIPDDTTYVRLGNH